MRTSFGIHLDCDPVWVYEREYGIKLVDQGDIYKQAIPRFLELFREFSISATLFIIGSELSSSAARASCNRAMDLGHTIGNHTYSHMEIFGSLSPHEQANEIRMAHAALTDAGASPKGYRTPGYCFTPALLPTLASLGYIFDGSTLPGPATLLMSTHMRLKGRSRKSFGATRNFFAPRTIRRHSGGIFLVPVAVTPYLRMPVHTTFIYQFGMRYLNLMMSMLQRSAGHHVLLFHAIDLLDHPTDPTNPILPLRKSFEERLEIVRILLSRVCDNVVLTEEILQSL